MDCYRERNDVATTLPLEVYTHRNFAADFFRQKLNFTGKQQNSVLWHPLGDLGVKYTVHLRLVDKRVVDFLLVLIELVSPSLTVDALYADINRNRCVRKGVRHFERKFQAEWGVAHHRLLASEN